MLRTASVNGKRPSSAHWPTDQGIRRKKEQMTDQESKELTDQDTPMTPEPVADEPHVAVINAGRNAARRAMSVSTAGGVLRPDVADTMADRIADAVMGTALPMAEGIRLFDPDAEGSTGPVDWTAYSVMHLQTLGLSRRLQETQVSLSAFRAAVMAVTDGAVRRGIYRRYKDVLFHQMTDNRPPLASMEPAGCPTPETHNWGCGCPTDQAPVAQMEERIVTAVENALSAWDAEVPGTERQHLHQYVAAAVMDVLSSPLPVRIRYQVSSPVTMICGDCDGLVDWITCPTGGWWAHRVHPEDNHDASPVPADPDMKPDTEDTLPQWLYQRYVPADERVPWENLSEEDRSYWEHHAAATRRAVARGGFKDPKDPRYNTKIKLTGMGETSARPLTPELENPTVAYWVDSGPVNGLMCLDHGAGGRPLISVDLPNGGECAWCRRDVLTVIGDQKNGAQS